MKFHGSIVKTLTDNHTLDDRNHQGHQSRVKGCWAPPEKIQMGPFNISKHLGRCVLLSQLQINPLSRAISKPN